MPTGIIYILTNPAMPGLLKIGHTYHDDVQTRMAQLYTTGVPVPFDCAYASRVNDPERVEKALHNAFGPQQFNPRREFFKIEVGQAKGIIKLMELEDVTPLVNRQISPVSAIEREAGEELKRKRPKMNYLQMGIPLGSELVCKVNGEFALVKSERTILFRNEETSLTNATRIALENDYNIAPAPYWTYGGKSLQDIYEETYLKTDQ